MAATLLRRVLRLERAVRRGCGRGRAGVRRRDRPNMPKPRMHFTTYARITVTVPLLRRSGRLPLFSNDIRPQGRPDA